MRYLITWAVAGLLEELELAGEAAEARSEGKRLYDRSEEISNL